jgi:N-methylhydantoinase A
VSREEIQRLFEEAYFKRFQVRLPEIRAMLVNLVTSVIGRRRTLPVAALSANPPPSATADEPLRRPLYIDSTWREARVFERNRLTPRAMIEGPAIVQQFDATTVIEPGATATVDALGNLRIQVGANA